METIIITSFQILVEIVTTIESEAEYLVTEDLEAIGTQQQSGIEVEE